MKIEKNRIAAVKDWRRPTCITQVQSFIGLLQFFRRFIKDFSILVSPLPGLIKSVTDIKQWDNSHHIAFESLITRLTTSPIFVASNWDKDFRCHTDESQVATGRKLTQKVDLSTGNVIAYFVRRLRPAEEEYSANGR